MKMADLLSVDRVIPCLRARNKHEVLRKLALPITRDARGSASAILDSVMRCAELPAFGPGVGVTLPHAFVAGLHSPIASFARLEPAVDFGAADGSLADLVMLLLSPAESTGNHLRALACIARTLRDPHVRDLLRASKCRDSLYVILSGSECGPSWAGETAPTTRKVSGTGI